MPGGLHVGEELQSEAPLLGEVGAQAQRIAELGAGMRCVGCGERITLGFRFTQFKPVLRGGATQVDTVVTTACSRSECSYAQETAPHANAMEMIEFAWPDETARYADGKPSREGEQEVRREVGQRKRRTRDRAARTR